MADVTHSKGFLSLLIFEKKKDLPNAVSTVEGLTGLLANPE